MGFLDPPEPGPGPELEDAPSGVRPVCGYCKQELRKIWRYTRELGLGDEQLLICPHCRAVLGFGVQQM